MDKPTKRLRWTKAGLGEWHGCLAEDWNRPFIDLRKEGKANGVVAVAARTGTHLDHYPWDWYFTTYGLTLVPSSPTPGNHKRHHAGVTDTLRTAKQEVEYNLASAGDD